MPLKSKYENTQLKTHVNEEEEERLSWMTEPAQAVPLTGRQSEILPAGKKASLKDTASDLVVMVVLVLP